MLDDGGVNFRLCPPARSMSSMLSRYPHIKESNHVLFIKLGIGLEISSLSSILRNPFRHWSS